MNPNKHMDDLTINITSMDNFNFTNKTNTGYIWY